MDERINMEKGWIRMLSLKDINDFWKDIYTPWNVLMVTWVAWRRKEDHEIHEPNRCFFHFHCMLVPGSVILSYMSTLFGSYLSFAPTGWFFFSSP